MSKDKSPKLASSAQAAEAELGRCGLVMPISSIDGCTDQHWREVRTILEEAITMAGFTANLVSDAEEVGIIQKRIIQNLYDNPIVVCDVSAKNPNVMFELGLRLAFDKPTIIVKDDKTSYSFDTAPIEHLTYPRDLRYSQILTFKSDLARKIQGTHEVAKGDPAYTTFLKHFGTFTVAKLTEREVSKDEALFEEMRELKLMVLSIRRAIISNDAASGRGRYDQASRAVEFIKRYMIANHMTLEHLEERKEEIIDALAGEVSPSSFPSSDEWARFCDLVLRSLIEVSPGMRVR